MPKKIRLLPEHIIKQIAAGEVIERPSSVIKELVENSIDANSNNIEISIRNGGKSFISVTDDGDGIAKDDLKTCLQKHATSKLNDDDLYNIQTMGFRGEALSSICYVGKLLLKSKEKEAENAYEIYAENNNITETKLSNLEKGTYIELRDLFFNIPARLKFLRSDTSEAGAIYKVIHNIALAHPNIGFKVYNNGKKIIDYKPFVQTNVERITNSEYIKEALAHRCNQVLGKDFIENSYFVYKESLDFLIYGFCSIPSFTSSQSIDQFFFVNKRFVKSKLFFAAMKAAYIKNIEKSRYPLVTMFLDINPAEIDVNVSPSKTEIKFKNTEVVRDFLISNIRKVIADSNEQKTSTIISREFINSFNYNESSIDSSKYKEQIGNNHKPIYAFNERKYEKIEHINQFKESLNIEKEQKIEKSLLNTPKENNFFNALKLGFAKAQFHKNWIISETTKGLVIVDQHAAHERINQEKLYKQYVENKISKQMVLLPEVIEISKIDVEFLLNFKDLLYKLGLCIDGFGDSAIIIREYPSILGEKLDFKNLIKDLLSDLKEIERPENFMLRLKDIIASISCHSSIRSGDSVTVTDMNNLLREIEETENATECPHGRPTYIHLTMSDIEKLFKRK